MNHYWMMQQRPSSSEKVVAIKSIENAGGTDGQAIVDRYAQVKQKILTLQAEKRKLKNELQDIEEEAVFFAQDNGVSILYGKEFSLQVTEQETVQYPYAKDPGRKELESLVKKSGIWENVSVMHLSKLKKYLRDNMFDKKLMDVFSRIATRVKTAKVTLIRRPDRY